MIVARRRNWLKHEGWLELGRGQTGDIGTRLLAVATAASKSIAASLTGCGGGLLSSVKNPFSKEETKPPGRTHLGNARFHHRQHLHGPHHMGSSSQHPTAGSVGTGAPMYGTHAVMGPRSIDFQHGMTDQILQVLPQSKITRAAKAMRQACARCRCALRRSHYTARPARSLVPLSA